MNSSRINAIDGLRGFAIISVCIHHCCSIENYPRWNNYISLGYFGGNFFLLLSGYFVTKSLLNLNECNQSIFQHLYKRFLRLAPLYYLALIVYTIILPVGMSIATERPWNANFQDWKLLLYGALFSTNISKYYFDFNSYFNVSWTVCVQEQFYLLWIPALLILRRKATFILVSAIVMSGVFRVIGMYYGLNNGILHMNMPFRMDSIAAGSLIAIHFRPEIAKHYGRHFFRLAMLLTAIFLVLLGFDSFYDEQKKVVIGYLILTAVGSLWLLTGLTLEPGSLLSKCLNHPWLVWYGRRSYAIYLFHMPVFFFLIFIRKKILHWDGLWYGPLFGLINVFLMAPVAHLIYRLIEEPIQRYRDRKLAQRQQQNTIRPDPLCSFPVEIPMIRTGT